MLFRSYVGQEPKLRAGTLRDALYYSLKHRPNAIPEAEQDEATLARAEESRLSGNSPFDINADWIDYEGAGVTDAASLTSRAMEVLQIVDMDQDVYQLGLSGVIDSEASPELAKRLMEARSELRERLQEPSMASMVELFDRDKYNTNLSVADNLVFGTPHDASLDPEALHKNQYVRKVLREVGLMDDFLMIGRSVAELMVELFADVAPDSELFEQFSFISADDLPEFRTML